MATSPASSAIDLVLPRFDVNEVHSISLSCSPEQAMEHALAAPAAPDRFVATLFRLRGLPRSTTVRELFQRVGFETLAATPTEIVVAAAGTPWKPFTRLRPFSSFDPGTVRIAACFRATRSAAGCELVTETRVEAVDGRALRAFRRYWLLVGPFSGLIRRRWLRATARRCRSKPPGAPSLNTRP